MKKKHRTRFRTLISLLLTALLLLPGTATAVLAADEDLEHALGHAFTFEELALMNDLTENDPVAKYDEDGDGFVEIKRMPSSLLRATVEYYIPVFDTGMMVTYTTSGTVSHTRYSAGEATEHQYQKWSFTDTSDGYYVISPSTDTSKCLTVNASTKAVTVSAVTSDYTNQKWDLLYSNDGIAFVCVSSDSAINGLKLYTNGVSTSVSTSITLYGMFNVATYVAPTSLSFDPFYVAPEETVTVSLNYTPANATVNYRWITWYTTSAGRIFPSQSGQVTGIVPGEGFLGMSERITQVHGSGYATVTSIANGIYYLENAYSGLYAHVKDGAMTPGTYVEQNEFGFAYSYRWEFKRLDDGYYSIRSLNSQSTNYYMAVSNDIVTAGAAIVIRSASSDAQLSNGMRWSVVVSDDKCILTAISGEPNSLVLGLTSNNTTNNITLRQVAYTDDTNYRDEWYMRRMIPTSGSELLFNDDLWNDADYVARWASYGYAIQNQRYPGSNGFFPENQQPGAYAGEQWTDGDTVAEFISAVAADFEYLNTTMYRDCVFQEIGKYEACPTGTYKIALFVDDPDNITEYHWYRQDADGFWSHKPQQQNVMSVDAFGNLIFDPEEAVSFIDGCDTFVGYFAVSPWNYMYLS